jgi:hypothetical protein
MFARARNDSNPDVSQTTRASAQPATAGNTHRKRQKNKNKITNKKKDIYQRLRGKKNQRI